MNPIVVSRKYGEFRNGQDITTTRHLYWCPGCDSLHWMAILPDRQANGAGWEFSGTLERPTYSPSQLFRTQRDGQPFVCHTFIRDGRIEFLGDCTHSLKGQTVELPPLPDWVVRLDLNDAD